jgi:phosphoglucosamine mutase
LGKQLFGTDGIRGVAGEPPLDGATVFAFGAALGKDLGAGEVVIGADTRESGPWIAETAAAGLESVGRKVRFAGIITTPGVAWLAKTMGFSAGVMISASHNPYQDNGLKVFGPAGFKLPDAEEEVIEQEILATRAGVTPRLARLEPDTTLAGRYEEYLLSTVSTRLDGMKVIVDCGNGAACSLAPDLFRRLGAEAIAISVEPDGRNINSNCGALHLGTLREAVLAHGADFGVAFDGDADRALFVARSGKLIDGDAVMLMTARSLKAEGRLSGDTVVATVMSNLGLEKALEREGIRMKRTAVGDKYVLEEMLRIGAALGGEQSGHVIFREYSTTGDGMLTALQVFQIARKAGQGLDELTSDLQVYPQKLVNIRVRERKKLTELPEVADEIQRAEAAFEGTGRVLVRFSGTEPLARVMVEGADSKQVEAFSSRIAEAIRREIGA